MQRNSQGGVSARAEYLVRQAQEEAMHGKYVTAVDYLKEVVEMEPRHTGAFTLLGDCYDCLGLQEQAIGFYDRALRLDPFHADAWFNKGMSLKRLGREEEAAQCIRKSIELYCSF